MGLLPFLILVILNIRLLQTIRAASQLNQRTSARQRRDQDIARMLVLVIIVFGVCNCFRMFINSYEVSLSLRVTK